MKNHVTMNFKAALKENLIRYRRLIGYARARPFGLFPSFKVYGPPEDSSVFAILACRLGFFEHHITRLLPKLVPQDAVVLDVGANIGALTCAFAHLAKRGKVYAFEASRTALSYLEKTIDANKLRNVEIVHRAVSEQSEETIFLAINKEFLGGSFVQAKKTYALHEAVKSLSLDDFCNNTGLTRLDLIKMDIEGFEINALKGAKEVLKNLKPNLLVECNALALRRQNNSSAEALFALLREIFPFIYIVQDDFWSKELVPLNSVEELMEILRKGRGNEDLLCSYQEWSEDKISVSEYLQMLKNKHGYEQEIILNPKFQIKILNNKILTTGKNIELTIELTNLSDQAWSSSGKHPIVVSYHLKTPEGKTLYHDGTRTSLPGILNPRESVKLKLRVDLPIDLSTPIHCWISPLQEGVIWFDEFSDGCLVEISTFSKDFHPQ